MEGLENMRDLMIRLGDSLKSIEAKVANPMPIADISNTEVMSKMADEIRKTHFRKKDPTPQIVSTVMGVIALISAMTMIIKPIYRTLETQTRSIKEIEARLDKKIDNKDAYNLKIMDNAHNRLSELEKGDQEDKTVNAMVMMQEDRIKTLEIRTLADRANHAKIDMLYMHFIKDHERVQ